MYGASSGGGYGGGYSRDSRDSRDYNSSQRGSGGYGGGGYGGGGYGKFSFICTKKLGWFFVGFAGALNRPVAGLLQVYG